MTVDEVVRNFRLALLGLTPRFERAGIAWRPPLAYDPWDDVATALFEALVVELAREVVPTEMSGEFMIAPYGLLAPDYSGRSVIEVLPPGAGGTVRVFYRFETLNEPLDMVSHRLVGEDGVPVSSVFEVTPLDRASFRLRLSDGGRIGVAVTTVPEL